MKLGLTYMCICGEILAMVFVLTEFNIIHDGSGVDSEDW